MRRTRLIALIAALALFGPAQAYADCRENFYEGKAPSIKLPGLLKGARQLCYSEFAVLHSAQIREPLYSADHLTRNRVKLARHQRRSQATQTFHDDAYLSYGEGSDLSDFVHSGFDRGHMTPNGDMDNPQAQGESFTLANMIPQDPDNNRNLWEGVEEAVRTIAYQNDGAYVVTIPVFSGRHTRWLHGRVAVPAQIAKAIYLPARNVAAAYLTNNAPGRQWSAITIAQLRTMTGIDPFPSVSETVKNTGLQLPPPIIPNRNVAHGW